MTNSNGMGRPSEDDVVFKIRVKDDRGSKSVYRTSEDVAFDFAQKCRNEGKLLYFARYERTEIIVK